MAVRKIMQLPRRLILFVAAWASLYVAGSAGWHLRPPIEHGRRSKGGSCQHSMQRYAKSKTLAHSTPPHHSREPSTLRQLACNDATQRDYARLYHWIRTQDHNSGDSEFSIPSESPWVLEIGPQVFFSSFLSPFDLVSKRPVRDIIYQISEP